MRISCKIAVRTALLALAGAVSPAITGPAMAAIVTTASGVWDSDGADGAQFSTSFILGPGLYDITWASSRPIDQVGSLDAWMEIRERELDSHGVVLSDQIFGAEGGFWSFPIGATGGSIHGFYVPPDNLFGGPDRFLLDTFRKSGDLRLHAQGAAVGSSWTFTIAEAPEPGTWTMMITGFALTGMVLRRRTAALAPTRGHC